MQGRVLTSEDLQEILGYLILHISLGISIRSYIQSLLQEPGSLADLPRQLNVPAIQENVLVLALDLH